jgi:isocitrate dehydrogenase
MKFIPADGSDE